MADIVFNFCIYTIVCTALLCFLLSYKDHIDRNRKLEEWEYTGVKLAEFKLSGLLTYKKFKDFWDQHKNTKGMKRAKNYAAVWAYMYKDNGGMLFEPFDLYLSYRVVQFSGQRYIMTPFCWIMYYFWRKKHLKDGEWTELL